MRRCEARKMSPAIPTHHTWELWLLAMQAETRDRKPHNFENKVTNNLWARDSLQGHCIADPAVRCPEPSGKIDTAHCATIDRMNYARLKPFRIANLIFPLLAIIRKLGPLFQNKVTIKKRLFEKGYSANRKMIIRTFWRDGG